MRQAIKTSIRFSRNGMEIAKFSNLITTIGANKLATNTIGSMGLYLSTNAAIPDVNEQLININTDIGDFPVGSASVNFTNIPVASYTITLPAGSVPANSYASIGLRDGATKITRALIRDSSGNPQIITIDNQDSLIVEYSFTLDTPQRTDIGDFVAYPANLARDGVFFQGNWLNLCGSIQNPSLDFNNVYQTNTDQIINNVHSANITQTSLGVASIDLIVINTSSITQLYDAISICLLSRQYLLKPNVTLQVPPQATARIQATAQTQ